MSTHRKLVRSAGIIGFFTAVSRVLGFIRDMIIAAAFGTGVGAEAFVVSFKIPNLLRDLVGEGAANAAFVPVLTECNEKKKEEFWPLVSTLFFIMAGILAVLAVLGVLFAPWVVRLMAPGFAESADPEKFPLTVQLTRVIFPYIFLIGLSALAMGALNSLKEFTSSAIGPALLNVCLIIAGVFFERRYGPMALVGGVLAGGILQLSFQIPPLVRRGFRLTKPAPGHPSVRRIGKLLIPRAMGSALYQINVFVDSILASFDKIVGLGGQSALYYSNRLFQLPLAVFGLSLAQAVLPTLSTQIVRKDREGFKKTLAQTARSLMLVIIPASVGLAVLARPIVRIIFQHGRFTDYSTMITSGALFFYAFGLLPCCFIKILANAFYSMQDTRTPVKVMACSVFLNVTLSLALMHSLKIAGLALASSISATVNMTLLYLSLRKRTGNLLGRETLRTFYKVLAAAGGMGIFIFYYFRFFVDSSGAGPRLVSFLMMFGGIALGIAVYLALVWMLRVEGIKDLLSTHADRSRISET